MGITSGQVETACPFCGHSPLRETEERCPACWKWLRELPGRVEIHNDAEVDLGEAFLGTRPGMNLITNAAEANPGLAAALLVALGLALGLVGMEVIPGTGAPGAYLKLATLNLVCGMLLAAYPGLVRRPVALICPLQVVAILYVGRAELPSAELLSLAAVPLAVTLGAVGEPGRRRRELLFCAGLALLLYSGSVRMGSRLLDTEGALMGTPQSGFRSRLPDGLVQLGGLTDLSAYVSLGALDPAMVLFTFGDPARLLGGAWVLAPAGRYVPQRLAQGFAEIIDAPSAKANPHSTDFGLKVPTTTFERGLGGGRTASVTAFKLPDQRVALLLLAGSGSDVMRDRMKLVRSAAFGPVADR